MSQEKLVRAIEDALDTEFSRRACHSEARSILRGALDRDVSWATEAVQNLTRRHDAPRILRALRVAAETGDVEKAIVALKE